MRDLVEESRAPRAQNAPLLVEHHARPDIDGLALVVLAHNRKARVLPIVVHVIILELALTRLVADRAVDRMIYQEKLEHGALRRLDPITVRAHHHAFSHGGVAGYLELRRLLHFHQAHAAVAWHRERLVIAVMRNLDSRDPSRVNQV